MKQFWERTISGIHKKQGEKNFKKYRVARSQTIKKNRFKGVLHGRRFLMSNTTFNAHMWY